VSDFESLQTASHTSFDTVRRTQAIRSAVTFNVNLEDCGMMCQRDWFSVMKPLSTYAAKQIAGFPKIFIKISGMNRTP
jgi:hypothetical protein